MTVVRNEFERGENNPGGILSQRMMAVAYEWHNYGKSTIGNRTDIERVPIDHLQAFYKKYYQPDNVMLVVAGKFDEKKALDSIAKYFGPLKKPKRKLDDDLHRGAGPGRRAHGDPAPRRQRRRRRRHLPHPRRRPPRLSPPCEVLDSVLDLRAVGPALQGPGATKKATSVSGSIFAWHDPGVLEISAEVDPKSSLDAVRATLIDTLENLAKKPVTDGGSRPGQDAVQTELRPADGQEQPHRRHAERMGRAGRLAAVLPAPRPRRQGDARRRQPRRPEVSEASNRTVGMFIPTKADQLARRHPGDAVGGRPGQGLQGTQTVAAGEAFDPTPENIEKRTKRTVPEQGPRSR